MNDIRIVSVRTGRARDLVRPAWDHHAKRTWHSAYVKDEVAGPVRVGPLGLEGDEQADRESHGGVHMAVLAYSADHYAAWRVEMALQEMGPGGFGENLAVAGTDERTVCVGDVYEAGTVELEVSQPRGPCANISRRWDRPHLLQRVVDTHRTGWYLRVRREGALARGDTFQLIERPHEGWTIQRILEARNAKRLDAVEARWLASCPALAPGWRELFARHL